MSATIANEPLVSIVLPTYNRAQLLPFAIQSVLDQSYSNLELIIVDDNSPDNTGEVVKSFDDARIRYVRNSPNLKLPRALNRGFSSAQGEYLTWTSDDNLYRPEAIARMVGRLQDGDCDFVYADYDLFSEQDENGNPISSQRDYLPSELRLNKGNHIGACFMYSRRLYNEIGDYDPELFLVEDYDYFLRAAKVFGFCHIPESLYYFRRDEGTLYLSRFCEVKASDIIVRYKNDQLSEREAVEEVVKQIIRNPGDLRSRLLRSCYHMVNKRSYRLTNIYNRLARRLLAFKVGKSVSSLIEEYDATRIPFKTARDRLCELMQKHCVLKYSD
jgi:glycosyltransferase involved in cell wall biosynthesis